jgi:ornithine cyclodeaminase
MDGLGLTLTPCKSAAEAVDGTHLVTVATAARGHIDALPDSAVKPGLHINGIGGDSPGKTELALATVKRAKIFVEYLPQTLVEGEIQRLTPEERKTHVKGEIWELVTKQKKGRESPNDITLYDAVGFALEDFSTLRLVYDLSTRYKIGTPLSLLPELPDPKDLISLLHGHHRS